MNSGYNTIVGLPIGTTPNNTAQCESVREPVTNRYHLLPEKDLRRHEKHPNCWCQPKEIIVGWFEKTSARVYVHKPLDGRGR